MEDYIYHRCSKTTKIALEHFCKAMNESNGEIFIIMAQKALCLYKLLVNHGLVAPRDVLSSTSIDFNKDELDWSQKKVVIVDDIIVSGSALSAATNRLSDFGVITNNLEIIAIARDEEYQTMKFTCTDTGKNLLKCAMTLSDPECISLSYEISRLLSYYGIPYDTDHPSYNEVETTNITLKKIYHSSLWDTYDVTNEDNKDNDITSLVLFPSDLLKSNILNKLDINLNNISHYKIRAYLHKYQDESTTLKVVPMVFLDEMLDNDIIAMFDFLKDKFFNASNFGDKWSTKTKFRFIQYYISHLLMLEFAKEIGSKDNFKIDHNWLKVQFGTKEEAISKILNNTTPTKNTYYFNENFVHPLISPNLFTYDINLQKKRINTDYDINEILLLPFEERHVNDEIPNRKDMCNLNLHFVNDYDRIEKFSNRLREGFSFSALMKIVKDFQNRYDCEKLVSLFIDRSVDLGIIVPITYHYKDSIDSSKNYICRAFRHGEDLPFGIADKYRIVYFLKCLYEQLFLIYKVKESPATVTFEKMIVLFIQMGLKAGGVFNRFLGFDNYPILKERFCIHGTVATYFDKDKKKSHVYTEKNNSVWISKWLKKNHLIRPEKIDNRKHYVINIHKVDEYLKNNDGSNLCEDTNNIIESIANMISNWYYIYENQKNKFKNDITALTSCGNQYTFASAIITELHYFKRYWGNQVHKGFKTILSNEPYSRDIFKYSSTQKALKSGRDKHQWYNSKKAQKIVLDVTNDIKTAPNPLYITWSKLNKDDNIATDALIKEKTNEALGFLYLYSVCYEWLSKGQLFGNAKDYLQFKNSKNTKKYIELFESLSCETPSLDENLFSLFEDIMNIDNITERIKELDTRFSHIITYCESLINDIEDIISKRAENYTVFYKSCFIIDIKTADYNETNKIILEFWNSLNEDIQKTKLNIVHFGVVDNVYHRYGFFFEHPLGKDKIESSYLYGIYNNITYIFNNKAFPTRTIYIPTIPNQVTMKHNTKDHLSSYAESFSRDFLDYISSQFINDSLHQTLLVETRNCSKSTIDSFQKLYSNETNSQKLKGVTLPESLNTHIFFTNDQRNTMNTYDYSTFGILTDEHNNHIIGTGFLFVYKKRIYGITCQHVINCITSEHICCKLKNSEIIFKLKPINKSNCSNPPIKAQDDVAILEPIDDILKSINYYKLLSEENCIYQEEQISNQSYRAFGYCTQNGQYVNSLKYNGLIDGGYYSLICKTNAVRAGFSGAGIISYDGELLGMHYQHNNNILDIIPSQDILKELQKNKSKKEIK